MADSISEVRQRLLARIGSLPLPRLAAVEAYLDQLDRRNGMGNRATAEPAPHTAPPRDRDWPHAPVHRISEHGTYFVTVGTLHKEHRFRGAERLTLLEDQLLSRAMRHGWHLEAWAVFSNHYHFVAHSGPESAKLNVFLGQLHAVTAGEINAIDSQPGRQVWHNYWDTKLTYQRSYLARLSYVQQNAVKHGLVRVANQYRWCSAAWFERTASAAQVKTIYGMRIDRVRAPDALMLSEWNLESSWFA